MGHARRSQDLNVWGPEGDGFDGMGRRGAPEIDAKKFITVYTFFGDHHRQSDRSNRLIYKEIWWAHQDSNLGPAD